MGSIQTLSPVSAAPVVDSQRWVGFDLVLRFNDTFFMALMFFISGLFVLPSLKRKGARKYMMDRLKRLGIPFVIGVPLLVPLAYYPGQLELSMIYGKNPCSYLDFWSILAQIGFGTAGPLWFLWLLLVFDFLIVVLYKTGFPLCKANWSCRAVVLKRPIAFFTVLLGISSAIYLPMLRVFDANQWIGIGPFSFQASRVFLYFVYFLAGTAVGGFGIDKSLFKSNGLFAKRWWVWLTGSLIVYVFIGKIIRSGLIFTVSCASIVFGAVARVI